MNVEEFLLKYGQASELIDCDKQLDIFIGEMKRGLSGEGSLAMIPTYLYEKKGAAVKAGGKTIVIDAGGTNFRSAAAYFGDNGEAVFEDLQKTEMPAIRQRLSKEEFYNRIAENVSRLLNKGGDIGFCFSYPVAMESCGDGVITSCTKGVDAPETVGTRVGECTLKAIEKYDGKSRKIVILNDTAAALLGGMACVRGEYSAYIGYIFGTGTNICYTEDVRNIVKASGLKDGRMLVNTECGNYDKFPCGAIDEEAFELTENAEAQRFEKMTSGKYLSTLICLTLKSAAKEGVLSRSFGGEYSLKDISEFLNGESNAFSENFATEEDRAAAVQICTDAVIRAAKLGAVANAATAVLSGKPNGAPVAVFAEGTTFDKLYGYAERFEKELGKLLSPRGYTAEILRCRETNLTGALAAALTQTGD